MSKNQRLLISLLTLVILPSCFNPEMRKLTSSSSELTRVSEPTTAVSHNIPITITPSSTQIIDVVWPTSETTPDFINIFNNPNQVTDGVLKISIEEPDRKCHNPGSIINIKVDFQNLSDKQIVIVDYNAIASTVLMGTYGQIITFLTNAHNKAVYSPGYYSGAEGINGTSPLFQEIQPESSFALVVEYYLPNEVAELDQNGHLVSWTLPDGRYFLKFIYAAYEYIDSWHEYKGSWKGKISSNQIEICVVN